MAAPRAFRLAYDGRGFHGFQRQPDVRTVEGALFDALRALNALGGDPGDRPAGYAAAGRTDAGVSALAQTVAFTAPDWLAPRALNAELPGSVRAWACAPAPEGFHATHDATRRSYAYHLHAPRGSTPAGAAVDDGRVREALTRLAGEHDFHNFTPDDRGTVRDLSTDLRREGAFLVVRFRAGGFARQLVRRLVALVRAVGTGDAGMEAVDRALAADPLPGGEALGPAPPEPLVLSGVTYPDLSFDPDPEAVATSRELFDRRRVEALSAARVAGAVCDGLGGQSPGSERD